MSQTARVHVHSNFQRLIKIKCLLQRVLGIKKYIYIVKQERQLGGDSGKPQPPHKFPHVTSKLHAMVTLHTCTVHRNVIRPLGVMWRLGYFSPIPYHWVNVLAALPLLPLLQDDVFFSENHIIPSL